MGIIMVNLFNGTDGGRLMHYCGKLAKLPDLIGRDFGQGEEIITAEINSF